MDLNKRIAELEKQLKEERQEKNKLKKQLEEQETSVYSIKAKNCGIPDVSDDKTGLITLQCQAGKTGETIRKIQKIIDWDDKKKLMKIKKKN